MAWRPPATDTGMSCDLAWATASCNSSTLRGLTMAPTRVRLSWEWTSFTTVPVSSSGIAEAYGERTGIGRATHAAAGHAASAAHEVFRNRRRFICVMR